MISKYLLRIINLLLCFHLIATSIKVLQTKGKVAQKNADNAKEEFWQNIKARAFNLANSISGTGFSIDKSALLKLFWKDSTFSIRRWGAWWVYDMSTCLSECCKWRDGVWLHWQQTPVQRGYKLFCLVILTRS